MKSYELNTPLGPSFQSPYGAILITDLLEVSLGSGGLLWKPRPISLFSTRRAFSTWNARYCGTPAINSMHNGYLHGCIFNVSVYAHRIIYACAHGEWPVAHIDHINGVKNDNRIENLRDVTPSVNGRNKRIASNNSSGVIGVYWHKERRKFAAQIGGPHKYLGLFDNLNDAVAARRDEESRRGFHPNHGK